jgi:hypothetical protein
VLGALPLWTLLAVVAVWLGYLAAFFGGATRWLFATGGSDSRIARNVFLSFCLATALGEMAVSFLATGLDDAMFGVNRTIAAVVLALTIFRYDILSTPLPASTLRRGALASVALATLFVVAQVAQNFFAAQYGLLLGGVIAGCFLFAAQPVQRMIERRSERRVGVQPASSQSELVFKAAVRTAISEGPVTSAQERHLSEVAHHLGIGAMDMIRLKQEVEAEGASVRVKEADS